MDYTLLAQERSEFREHAAEMLAPVALQSWRQVVAP